MTGQKYIKKWAFPVMFILTVFSGTANIFASSAHGAAGDVPANRDVVIKADEISPAAKFYPILIDGTRMEVIAVKAPDGSIRTAFNTCQICYDSGRGYYIQEGNALVCQNCGNRFVMARVEVVSGGCNPVPILPKNKVVTDKTITIPYAFLKEAKALFAGWKREY